MWPEPLLASGFNRGKTVPGGGRGSRSPLLPLPLALTLLAHAVLMVLALSMMPALLLLLLSAV